MLFILGEVSGLLGYDAVSLGEWFQMFQRIIVHILERLSSHTDQLLELKVPLPFCWEPLTPHCSIHIPGDLKP